MKDRRTVDELTIEELEELLRVRKRQERLSRVQKKAPARPDPLSNTTRQPVVRQRRVASPSSAGGAQYSAVIEASDTRRKPRRRLSIQWSWVWDKVLLLVELLALLGLVMVVVQMALMIRQLNEESQETQAAPVPSPTPMIRAAVLPGGHTPPDAQGRSEPDAVPPHLRGLVEELTPLPVPTPGPEQAQRIVIPGLGVDAPVVEGDDWESLKKGAGHHIGSVNPGERGNCIISAHNDIYGEIFRDLPELKVGDEVRVDTQTQSYRYVVQQTRIIEPTEVSVMAPTRSSVLTLISCYPYAVDTHRIVVIAGLEP